MSPAHPLPIGCAQGAELGLSGGRTVTVTVSGSLSLVPSLTTSWKTRSVLSPRGEGAVKVGVAVFAPVSVTLGPLVWVHV